MSPMWWLAHQGGWDEALWVVGPLLVVAGLLALANRRANRNLLEGPTTEDPRRDPATMHPDEQLRDREPDTLLPPP